MAILSAMSSFNLVRHGHSLGGCPAHGSRTAVADPLIAGEVCHPVRSLHVDGRCRPQIGQTLVERWRFEAAMWDHGAMAAPLDQAPAWVRDLLGSEREEAAADIEQATLLARMRAGEPGIAVSFEELASRLGLDLNDDATDEQPARRGADQAR